MPLVLIFQSFPLMQASDNRYVEYWPKTFPHIFWSTLFDIQLRFSYIQLTRKRVHANKWADWKGVRITSPISVKRGRKWNGNGKQSEDNPSGV